MAGEAAAAGEEGKTPDEAALSQASPTRIPSSPMDEHKVSEPSGDELDADGKVKDEASNSSENDIEIIGREEYVRRLQTSTYKLNIERALILNDYQWDIADFLYHEKHVDGIYSYLDKFYDDDYEMLSQYYEACIMFMKTGHLPKEIAEKTLSYQHAFGPLEFFDRDVEKVNAWATSIQILDFKLRHNDEFLEKYVNIKEIVRDEDDEDNTNYLDDVIRNE